VTEPAGARDRLSEYGFGGHLIINGEAADQDLVEVTLVDAGGHITGPVSMSLPLHDLSHTRLTEALARDDNSEVAASARAYGRVLRRNLRATLEGLPFSEAASAEAFGTEKFPLLVSVAGPPRVHQVMWEALDADGLPQGGPGVLVVHLPWVPGAAGSDVADRTRVRLGREAAGHARLRWIGARPFANDLPRYLIAGPVTNRVLDSDAVSFDVLRTNATADEALALMPLDTLGPLITHLDVHGKSRMRTGQEAGLIAEPEFAAFFREGESYREIPDQAIADAATASGCFMFLTNACFGAQQREVGQWPFPARLVRSGCKVAIAARDPLSGNAAMLFFTALYAAITKSKPVGQAYFDARRFLAMHPSGQESAAQGNLSSRYALQPVLWASSVEDLAVYFSSPDEHPADGRTRAQGVSRLAPYIEVARLDEGFARFVATLEDLHWSGAQTGQIELAPRCDLDGQEVAEVVTELRRVFGTRAVEAAERSADAVSAASVSREEARPALVFPEFTDLERLLLVSLRFIGEPNPLRELLGIAVHAEARYLDYLEHASSCHVAQALLVALSWTDTSAPPVPLSATTQSAEQIIDAECRRAVDDRDDAELLGQALADAHRIDCALPVVTLDSDEFMHVTAPRLCTVPHHYLEELSRNGACRILAFDETDALDMRRRDQVAMRQRMKPEAVVVTDLLWRRHQQPKALKLGENARWNDGTRRVCAAWLAIAVAYRQVGLINPRALRAATFILNLVDGGVAVLLSGALAAGLPGWLPLADSSVEDQYQEEASLWQRLHYHFDDSDELDAPSDTTRYAAALMHVGRHSEALEVSERLIQRLQPVAHGTDLDERNNVISTHAYILARNGRVKEALALAVPEIPNLGQLSLYRQCEFLHLLGDLMHYQEKFAAAISYFLQERTLRPPALHRRLHNRSHLLNMLIQDDRDPDLIAQIAVEGLAFAYAAQAPPTAEEFAATIADYADLLSEERRKQILDNIQHDSAHADSQAAAIAVVALRTTRDEPLDAQERALLESQAGSTGALNAFACFRLASQPDAPVEEKIRLLRLAAEEPTRHGDHCRLALLGALWQAEDWRGLDEHATRLLSIYPTYGRVHAALSASAYMDGRRSDAIEHLARAACYTTGRDILMRTPKLLLMLQADDLFRQEADARNVSMLLELTNQLESGMDTAETLVPGMSLTEVIERLYDYNKYQDPMGPGPINTLIAMSERAWDRADYPVAINARRRACQLIERTGDAAKLAMELGWLASLVKQAGNVEEALSLYQRAIAAGRDHLRPEQESSLLGRYANLLHQIGAYEPAVRTQWMAVLAQKQQFLVPENPFPPAPETLEAALAPDGLDTTQLPRWAILAVNFANCLESAGHYELAAQALRAALTAIETANTENPAEMAKPNGAQLKQLFRAVRANIQVHGIDVASIPVPD
jgi:tetratricopeptide (TPR) repeat protein